MFSIYLVMLNRQSRSIETKTMPGDYDFGLSTEQEARAQSLHESSISIDMCSMGPGGPALYDRLPQDVIHERLEQSAHSWQKFRHGMELPYAITAEGASDALRMFCAGHTGASFALTGVRDEELSPLERLKQSVQQIEWMDFANTAEDFRKAQADGTYVTYGFAQPGITGLPRELEFFDKARSLGVRSIMLTYNRQDFVGSGCTERTNSGLSNYGIDVVAKLNDIGIIIDTSHCGKQTTLDACKASGAPVTANHTSAEGVYSHDRAKSDQELEAIAATGGLIGVYAVPFFLASPEAKATVEVMLDHIDYIVDRVGWQHVGIGTDWPFMLPHGIAESTVGVNIDALGFRSEHGIAMRQNLVGYDDARDFINFTRGLVSRGHDDDAVRGILGSNFLRIFETVCG